MNTKRKQRYLYIDCLLYTSQRRIDLLTDGFVESVRGRLASGAVRGEDLDLVDAALGDFAFVKAAYHIGGLLLGIRLNKGEVPAEVQLRASFIDVLGIMAVSYTHLDVYKRQVLHLGAQIPADSQHFFQLFSFGHHSPSAFLDFGPRFDSMGEN